METGLSGCVAVKCHFVLQPSSCKSSAVALSSCVSVSYLYINNQIDISVYVKKNMYQLSIIYFHEKKVTNSIMISGSLSLLLVERKFNILIFKFLVTYCNCVKECNMTGNRSDRSDLNLLAKTEWHIM